MRKIVLMVTENWWPANKSEEIGKTYIKIMTKYPNDRAIEKPLVEAAIWTDKEVMHSITVASIKPGKVKESMDLASKRLLELANDVEGYRYHIRIAYDLVEAMPLIGLKAPET